MTGDIKFAPDASVIIMTTEILRNLLYKQNTSTKNLGITADLSIRDLDAVVFDECHYINDKDRGAVWEETMILLPREVNLVLLSATIDGPELFASWLGELKKKPIYLISTQYRIVPLQHAVYRGETMVTIMDNKEQFESGLYKGWIQWQTTQDKAAADHKAAVADRRRGGYEDAPISRGAAGQKSFKHQMNELIGRLDENTLLPALFFVFSRKNCERYAANVDHTLLDSSDTAAVKHIIDFHLHRYGDELRRLPQYNMLRGLLERGIAFHHSGVLPVLKEIVEILFGKGFVKLLFATETFAVGINMPTKTVVFTGYRKFDETTDGQRMLNTDEYIQMAGRAGRRGKDDKGLVLYLPDRQPETVEDVKRMMTGAKATFQSRMTFHYDFLLKTLQAENLDWLGLMRQSYWYRRHERLVDGVKKELIKEENRLVAMSLTEAEITAMEQRDELAAKIKASVNASRREAQKAWSAWENSHMGARWSTLVKDVWPVYKKCKQEVQDLRLEVAAMADPSTDVWPSLRALGDMGLLEVPVKPEALNLTPLGIMATEVNEGHAILMSKTYARHLMKEYTPEQILTVLAAFIQEGTDAPPVDSLQVPAPCIEALWAIHRIGQECQTLERAAAAPPAPKGGYWDLNTFWVEPVWRWLNGATTHELSADYEFYEGNLLRTLMKLVNILEEWRSLASLEQDVYMLDKMRGYEDQLLKGIAVCDSLYLRI
jgi:superfamily II RNA helicase